MKSLKESLLGNMEDTLEKGDEIMDKYECFGSRFEFIGGICGSQSATTLSANALKKLTKNMSYMHDYMEKAKFDKQNKLKMLANLIDHIPLKDLGIEYDDDLTSNEVRKRISKNLKNYIKDTGVVSKEEVFHIWVASFNITGPNDFEIIISRTDKWGVNSLSKFRYKILY